MDRREDLDRIREEELDRRREEHEEMENDEDYQKYMQEQQILRDEIREQEGENW